MIEQQQDIAALFKFGIYEEYRRLSYGLNRESTFEERGIQKIDELHSTVTAPNDEGVDTEYDVIRIQTSHSDLVPFVMIPKNNNPGEPCHVRLLFQGTASLMGWNRNFTGVGSAGINEFEKDKASMIEQLHNAIKDLPHVNLSIVGHSLGGADSQNMMVEIMKHVNNEQQYHLNKLQNIDNLELCVFNSAGVRQTTAQESLEYAQKLHNKKVGISANFSVIGGDIVQQVGEANILVDMPPEVGAVNVVKTATDKENYWSVWSPHKAVGAAMRTVEAHTGHWFTEQERAKQGLDTADQARGRMVFCNDTPEGREGIRLRLQEHKLIRDYPHLFGAAQVGKHLIRGTEDFLKRFQHTPETIAPATFEDLSVVQTAYQLLTNDKQTDQTANFLDVIDDVAKRNPILIRAFFEAPITDNGQSFANWCASEGRDKLLAKLCQLDKDLRLNSLNVKDANGKTPLYYAVENSQTKCVQVLRDFDANVNQAGPGNSSVLPVAVKVGRLELLDVFLDSKRFVARVNKNKVSRYAPDEEGNSAFHLLATSNHPDAAETFSRILIDRSKFKGKPYSYYLQATQNNQGKSVLDLLIENNRVDIIERMQKSKYLFNVIDYTKENKQGFTPIEYALYVGNKDLAEKLRSQSGMTSNYKMKDVENALAKKLETKEPLRNRPRK